MPDHDEYGIAIRKQSNMDEFGIPIKKQEQPPISSKDIFAKYGITNYKPVKESTKAIQPEETLKGDIAKETGNLTEQKRKADKPIAIKNSAELFFKNNNVKPTSAQLKQKQEELTQMSDNGDVALYYDNQGNPKMGRNVGGFQGFLTGVKEGFNKEGAARKFIDMDVNSRIKQMNEDYTKDNEYLKPITDYTALGGLGTSIGQGTPMMAKAATGAIAGAGLAALAPETGGASLEGIAPTMAFLFSAPGAANVAYMDELKRRYYEGKQQGLSDEEAYHKADHQALLSEGVSLATNAFLSKIPASNATGEGVNNALKAYAKTGAKTAGEFGGVTAAGTATTELTAKAQGYNKEQSIGDILVESGKASGCYICFLNCLFCRCS